MNLLADLEEFVHAIHAPSARRHRAFVRVNCVECSPSALESTLFGAEGATRTGTLYLEDIVGLPLALQVKLLQVLQDRRLSRGGGTRAPMPVDVIRVCVIAATNRDLKDAVARGEFLGELYNLLRVSEKRPEKHLDLPASC